MNKLNYGTFDISNGDIAFATTNGYDEPQSELERRKQLSYPLKELKTFINNTVTEDSNGNAVQLVLDENQKLQYRTEPSGELSDIETKSSLPTGGTSGQYLKKKTNTDYDVEWGSVQNGIVKDTLWTNSNVFAPFLPQTLTLPDFSSYKFLLFTLHYFAGTPTYDLVSCLIPVQTGVVFWVGGSRASSGMDRNMELKSYTQIEIGEGRISGTASDSYAIPYQIFGIK